MIANPNILNVQVVPSTPMFISSNSPGQKQVMHPEWIQWYRAIQTRVGGATGTLITSIDFKDVSTTPIYTITNTEDTSSGTGSVIITIALNPEESNLIFAGPTSGSAGEPIFRRLINNDFPIVNITHGGTGLITLPADGQLLIGDTATNEYIVANITGTLNRLDITNGGGTISLDIDSNYIGQTSITTLGTITTGVWNATTIDISHGGTGSTSTPTTGQILIGDSGGNFQLNTIAGTANEIIVTNSSGEITLSLPENVVIPTPSTGSALTITGADVDIPALIITAGTPTGAATDNYAILINGSSTTNKSLGLAIIAGTSSGDAAIFVENIGASIELFTIFGDGSFLFNNNKFKGNASGNLTIAPASGVALTITGLLAGAAAITLNTTATTGSKLATFNATNKPGTNNQTTPAIWLPINFDGTLYFIPGFAA